MLFAREISCLPTVIKFVKPDILDLFADRYGIALSTVKGLWMQTGPGVSFCANAVLSDDRIVLLDVNYPASMGPAVSFARAAVNHSRIAYDYELQETPANSEATGQSMFLQPFSFALCGANCYRTLGYHRRSSRSIDV